MHFDWEFSDVPAHAPVMTFYPAEVQPEFLRPAPRWVPSSIIHGDIPEPNLVKSLMLRLDRMLGGPSLREQLASRGVLLEILARLLDAQSQDERTKNHKQALASRVRAALDETLLQPTHPHSVRDLLATLGYSYEHLARIFKKQYGLSPVEYLQSLRVERARFLLTKSTLTVQQIADSLGYQDSIYFTRLFKRQTGKSPARYRKATLAE